MTETTFDISNPGDVFDIRDVIDRFLDIEEPPTRMGEIDDADDDKDEREQLRAFLDEVRGNGGDHQWRGDWYPTGFIADSYFENYAREFADDIGAIKDDNSWPYTCIDWEQAAKELRMDYSSVDVGDSTYWYR